MKQSNKTEEELENPMLFWASIGVAISASTATIMKFELLGLVLTITAGLVIGAAVGYFSKDKADI